MILLQAKTPGIVKEVEKISQGLPREVRQFLEFNLFKVKDYEITVFDILLIVIFFLLSKLLILSISSVLRQGFFRRKQVDAGRQEAVIQLVRYFTYTIFFILALEVAGVRLSILLAGSAALLVGVGLGLQQTFNDLVSGLILLFEGSINVGDIVELNNGLVGRVTNVGLRTSTVETRDSIGIIVPNSKFINDNIINWSHNRSLTRFIVQFRASYRNDPAQVTALLLASAKAHPELAPDPEPTVRLRDFGDSGVYYELLFWTFSAWRIEYIKSDIRFDAFARFRAAGIEVPYPQQDLHLRSGWEGLRAERATPPESTPPQGTPSEGTS
ncbi:mechanosensitive ion channel [Rhabdobacter roseus]|uniref:Small-conductance mechanosensitive channel n=1 Tax=Rhabdobacter roseus TaxID=1655419 RepID=A0A840TP13_9BACT|nr:mechanosensitive ion channel domain-containing protein [Rhabdobacter roseus]MBB5285094.1 small-conductance mechanosensitive channel [Rhabdobacter roseus]